jgi:hypothetical protein
VTRLGFEIVKAIKADPAAFWGRLFTITASGSVYNGSQWRRVDARGLCDALGHDPDEALAITRPAKGSAAPWQVLGFGAEEYRPEGSVGAAASRIWAEIESAETDDLRGMGRDLAAQIVADSKPETQPTAPDCGLVSTRTSDQREISGGEDGVGPGESLAGSPVVGNRRAKDAPRVFEAEGVKVIAQSTGGFQVVALLSREDARELCAWLSLRCGDRS